MIAVVVSRGSHVQYVPHTGFPHSEPRKVVSAVNSTPISADACATRSNRIFLVTRYAMEHANTTPKLRYASHAAGTWTYINRCTLPWFASGGATASDMIAEATSARTA